MKHLPARHIVPVGLFAGLLLLWFFMPSADACALFAVPEGSCSSWTSGLFGVGLGGVLTLWASWVFGDKSSQDFAQRLDQAVDEVIRRGSDAFVADVKRKLDEVKGDLGSEIPARTLSALEAQTLTTVLFASRPAIRKVMPQIIDAVLALIPEDEKKRIVDEAQRRESGGSGAAQ